MAELVNKLEKEKLKARLVDIAIGAGIDSAQEEDGEYWCFDAAALSNFICAIQREFSDQVAEERRPHFCGSHDLRCFGGLNDATEYLWSMGVRK